MSNQASTEEVKAPKKGDVIFVANDWNGNASIERVSEPQTVTGKIALRSLKVQAWGQKQAHFTDTATGEKVGYRGYTRNFEFSWTADGLAPRIEEIVEYKLSHMKRSLDIQEGWLNDYRDNEVSIRGGHVARVEKQLAAAKASEVRIALIDWNTGEEIREIRAAAKL